jgi:alginate production protein
MQAICPDLYQHFCKIRGKLFLLVFYVIVLPGVALSGQPEYMKLDYAKVPAVEVKGYWDTSGVFIATDIEMLPKPRRPKMRGEIQDIDLDNGDPSITLYGTEIELYDKTEFTDTGKKNFSLKDLKEGQRVEVSCKVDADDGEWEARKIKVNGIKDSDKIKGSITRIQVDGNPPDTIEIEGLMIILTEKTDVNAPAGSSGTEERELFKDQMRSEIYYGNHIKTFGNSFFLAIDYRQSYRSESDYDLWENLSTDYSDTEPEIRVQASNFFKENIMAFSQFRIRKKYALKDDRINPPADDYELNLTQLFLLARNIGVNGLALQIGRQDFDERREWLYDEYLDAFRVYYYGARPLVLESAVIHAVEPLKDKFRTWTDIFAQARWYLNKDNYLRAYYFLRKDTDESRNREPIWFGMSFCSEARSGLKPWFEVSIMRGEDKGKKNRATAFDIGTTVILDDIKLAPSVTAGYAFGSGDKTGGDLVSNEFRQTGYEDNVNYVGGLNTVFYYGELLNPELSNLKILTLGAGFRPINDTSLEFIYHTYDQHHPDDKLRADLVDPPARPNNVDTGIGWEVDFVLAITNIWQRATFTWVYGLFKPGEAFAPYQEYASLNRLNLRIEI